MASQYGIEGFCYWHYWFAGKRLLERPFAEILKSGEPKFPFCLAWANQTWTGIWHGEPDRILIEQTYPGIEDYRTHFYELLNAFLLVSDPENMFFVILVLSLHFFGVIIGFLVFEHKVISTRDWLQSRFLTIKE